VQLPTAVCAASVLYSRSAGESEGPLPCGQGGGAPTSLTGVWRLDPGHFLCVGQMSEVYLLLKKAAHVYFSGYFTPLRPPSQGCSVSRLTGLDCSKGWLSMLARAVAAGWGVGVQVSPHRTAFFPWGAPSLISSYHREVADEYIMRTNREYIMRLAGATLYGLITPSPATDFV